MTEEPVLVTSRSFEEYVAFFDLDPRRLPARVVDVSAGASGFVAGASRRGVRALALDPAYADRALLVESARASASRGGALIAEHAGRCVYDWYGSPAARTELRRQALQTFEADLARHPHRYLPASLPRLPLATGAFTLAVCSHLLFTWADVFDEHWHEAALIELTRIAEEVRIFPLVHQGDGRVVGFLEPLRDRLRTVGVDSSIDPVRYEFQRGARHMLRLRRRRTGSELGQEA